MKSNHGKAKEKSYGVGKVTDASVSVYYLSANILTTSFFKNPEKICKVITPDMVFW